MRNKLVVLLCSMAMAATMFSGCALINVSVNKDGAQNTEAAKESNEALEEFVSEETAEISEAVDNESLKEGETEATEENIGEEVAEESKEDDKEETAADDAEDIIVRIGGLKGPTSIGLLELKSKNEAGESAQGYDFVMATAADEITTALVKGDLDIALIPANVASVLYNKTEGGVSVIDINTLGVLYMVSGDDSISEPADLEGKSVYLTGKGTTPDYVLQYILGENGIIDNVTLDYKSEATEVAALLAEDESAVGLLPQPFVTAALAQNDKLAVVMDMTREWDKLQEEVGSRLVTGVTVVRNDFLNEHEDAVKTFLEEHKASTEATSENLEEVAALAVEAGIIAKEPIAKKAIPNCNIVCITGEEMKDALSGYLEVLYNLEAKSIGGKLPGEEFYY